MGLGLKLSGFANPVYWIVLGCCMIATAALSYGVAAWATQQPDTYPTNSASSREPVELNIQVRGPIPYDTLTPYKQRDAKH